MTARREGEPQDVAPPPTGSSPESAGEMDNETEVEETVAPRKTPAADQALAEDGDLGEAGRRTPTLEAEGRHGGHRAVRPSPRGPPRRAP